MATTGARGLDVLSGRRTFSRSPIALRSRSHLRGQRDAATIGAIAFTSIALDWQALAFALATSLVVGLLFGLAPAIGSTRASLTDALKTDRTAGGAGIGRRALVVTQIALALVLLVGSGLMVRSLVKLLTVDVGFDPSNVLTFRVDVPPGVAGDSMPGFYLQILDHVRAVPGVADAALDGCAPFAPTCRRLPFQRTDLPVADKAGMQFSGLDVVTPNWFSLMRVRLVRGRPLRWPIGPAVGASCCSTRRRRGHSSGVTIRSASASRSDRPSRTRR